MPRAALTLTAIALVAAACAGTSSYGCSDGAFYWQQSTCQPGTLIDDGRHVGQTAAFVAELDGTPVELEPTDEDGRFVNARSDSTFSLRGRATDGPLAGERLEAVPHDDTFWFVWAAFEPETRIAAT